MSPLFVTAESRERSALGDPIASRIVADRFLKLAERVGYFLDEATELLCFEQYDALRESEIRLLALAELLQHNDSQGFLETELAAASDRLQQLMQRPE